MSNDFSIRYKSIKCIVADPSKVRLDNCYVKAYSRTFSSLNGRLETFESFEHPSNVIPLISLKRKIIWNLNLL